MKGYRHTGLRGCVIMTPAWKPFFPRKESGHENLRISPHPDRHCCQPTASLAVGGHGVHRPYPGRITHFKKGVRRKAHGQHLILRRREFGRGGSGGTPPRLGHFLVSLP